VNKHVKIESPSTKEGKALVVAGLREGYNATTVNDIPALWQRMGPYFGKLPKQVGHSAYGLVMNMRDQDNFDYLAGVEVFDSAKLPEGLTSVNIPAQRYAIFPHCDHVSKLKDTMHAIWRQWSPSWGQRAERRAADAPGMIEYYGPEFDAQTGMGDIEVWVPIAK
jgi:AraC family transcriptional regulator